MRQKLAVLRTKVGMAAIGGALLLTGVGFGANAAISSPGANQVSDSSTVETSPAPESTDAPTQPAVAPEAVPPADSPASVEDVTTPDEAAPAPETIPAPQVNPDGSLPDGWLPPQNPGEPPVAPDPGSVPAEKKPGEPGYVG